MKKTIFHLNAPVGIKSNRTLFSKIASVLLAGTFSLGAYAQNTSTYYELEKGLIIDLANKSTIVMHPTGGMQSLDMSSGTQNWKSIDGDKPLAVIDNKLIAQKSTPDLSNKLKVAQIDASNGNFLLSKEKDLPSDVHVTISNTLKYNFNAHVNVVNNKINLSWDYKESLTKGELFDAKSFPNSLKGVLRLNKTNLQLSSLSSSSFSMQNTWKSIEITGNQKNASFQGRQFVSVQSDYRVAIKRISDDSEWLKYEWTVFTANGNVVGKINSHFSYRPFYIENNVIVFTTPPYSRLINGELQEFPKSIHGYNLTTNNEVWVQELRDTQYRGPYPP